jgi:hypothetical protein
MNIRLMVIGVLGAGLALSQAACGPVQPTGAAPSASEGSARSPSASDGSGTSPSASDGSGTSPAGAKTTKPRAKTPGSGTRKTVTACGNDDLKATVTLQPTRGDGAMRGLVAVVNTGKHSCKLEGRASISLVNAADEVVRVPTREVDEPGEAVAITLRPGRSAFEGIKWTPCDKGDDTCGAGNTLRFNVQASTDGPAAELDGFPAPESSNITMKSLRVGTLQPLTQGVVAW